MSLRVESKPWFTVLAVCVGVSAACGGDDGNEAHAGGGAAGATNQAGTGAGRAGSGASGVNGSAGAAGQAAGGSGVGANGGNAGSSERAGNGGGGMNGGGQAGMNGAQGGADVSCTGEEDVADITGRLTTDGVCATKAEGATLTGTVCNRGTLDAPQGVPVAFYVNALDRSRPACEASAAEVVPIAGCIQISCEVAELPGDGSTITMVVNVSGSSSAVNECNVANNNVSVLLNSCARD